MMTTLDKESVVILMKITVSTAAQKWFANELEVPVGGYVHFFGKYGGKTSVHTGFSVGMRLEKPDAPVAELVQEGITYFIEATDEWFFSEYSLHVDFDKQKEEPIYGFTES